jgi:tetraacyldisaccharide 4'-kinase
LTVGGTGKTPLTLYCAEQLAAKGYQLVVLSRGYKGTAEKQGAVVSDGHQIQLTPRNAGDEPFMMAQRLLKHRIPVMVGKDRYKMGLQAADQFQPDVILCDDAFQHLALHRDINLLLLDSRQPFGNTHLLPRGPLREPISALHRADGLILTRSATAAGAIPAQLQELLNELAVAKNVFVSRHVPVVWKKISRSTAIAEGEAVAPSDHKGGVLMGKRAFAFAGLARNQAFKQSVDELGGRLSGFIEYPDHHHYRPNDLQQLTSAALATGADLLVTTEKDYVKLDPGFRTPLDLIVLRVQIDFGNHASHFLNFMLDRLSPPKRPL